jgi:hypothetical protein
MLDNNKNNLKERAIFSLPENLKKLTKGVSSETSKYLYPENINCKNNIFYKVEKNLK